MRQLAGTKTRQEGSRRSARQTHFWPRGVYHRHYDGSGHVWQGRFKAFPVQSDEHSLTVLRYVERNPLRAKMVERSQD